ncbi:unnamed protein product [Prorocentrum cordatum]|uniref:Uncharacterized protein n=1 Tax=Prorocentrum cordatum TaxID=2364126 RepID=A0ABN9RW36_9DINO|nr:unnamed protein product [Polarella glacialis]
MAPLVKCSCLACADKNVEAEDALCLNCICDGVCPPLPTLASADNSRFRCLSRQLSNSELALLRTDSATSTSLEIDRTTLPTSVSLSKVLDTVPKHLKASSASNNLHGEVVPDNKMPFKRCTSDCMVSTPLRSAHGAPS